jgi:hypothetical protein
VSFAGTYNISGDNRGAFTIVTASGSRTFSLVLSAISNGVAHQARFVEFDDATGTQGRRGSGILRKQDTTAFSQSKINGPYALGLQGQDSSGRREAIVGAFSASGSGTISSGVADQNIAGTTTNPSLSGSYTAPSPTSGRAVVLLSVSGSSTLNMSAYVVSATELLVMTTGDTASDGLLSGTILSRSSTPSDNSAFNAPAIYYEVASDPQTPTSPIAEVGLLKPDGNGNVSVELDRQAGRGILQDQTFVATYTVQPGSRVVMSGWSGDLTSPPRVLYLISKDAAFFLDESSQTGFGFVEVQTAPHSGGFNNSSLSGNFSMGTVFPPVSGNSNATGLVTLDGAGTFSLFADVSTTSGWFVNQSTKGTYSITTQGRGVVTGLDVSSASINSWTLFASLFIGIPFVYGSRKCHNLRGRKTAFCLALWIVAVAGPAGCPPQNTNQLVLYVVSPAKALMVNEQSLGGSPQITVLEQ